MANVDTSAVWIRIALISVACPTIAVVAFRRWKGRGLWATCAVCSVLLGAYGWVRWARTPNVEAPLLMYVLGGVLPPIAAALAVFVVSVKGGNREVQFVFAMTASFLTSLAVLFGVFLF